MKIPTVLSHVLARLPEHPPAFALASALNLSRQRLWPEEDFCWLAGRTIRIQISDLGCGVALSWANGRFITSSADAEVTFSASAADYYLIASRQEDPDTLFFQRRLSISGNTELGLQLKNLLDATDFSALLRPAGLST